MLLILDKQISAQLSNITGRSYSASHKCVPFFFDAASVDTYFISMKDKFHKKRQRKTGGPQPVTEEIPEEDEGNDQFGLIK